MLKLPYKKLLVWQKSMELAKAVYKKTDTFPARERYGIVAQIRRAAVSIPSNIAEGSQRKTSNDFAHFLLIAKGSVAELETQLALSMELQYVTEEGITEVFALIEEVQKMLRSLHVKVAAAPH